ncbi:MAG TPA: hypothetical protein VGX91_14260 [Candidatus Cybelea sp.]|nr:hypothetical protein [Candidatus Cybelea sp.]
MARHETEAIVHLIVESLEWYDVHASRGKLDGKREAVQAAAHLGNHRRIFVGHFETVIDGTGTVREERYRGIAPGFDGAESRRAVRRHVEGRQTIHTFAAGPQRLSARREHLYGGTRR